MTSNELTNDNPQEAWECNVVVAGVDYKVTVSDDQKTRAQLIVKPKPVTNDDNKQQVLADHRDSVRLCGYMIVSAIYDAIERHDSQKLNQTPDEHHQEKHHWTFNAEAANGLCIWDVTESIADYIATVYGRAEAGRGFDIMHPETHYDVGDVLMMTCLSLIEWMGIGSVSPKPEPLPEAQSEGDSQ